MTKKLKWESIRYKPNLNLFLNKLVEYYNALNAMEKDDFLNRIAIWDEQDELDFLYYAYWAKNYQVMELLCKTKSFSKTIARLLRNTSNLDFSTNFHYQNCLDLACLNLETEYDILQSHVPKELSGLVISYTSIEEKQAAILKYHLQKEEKEYQNFYKNLLFWRVSGFLLVGVFTLSVFMAMGYLAFLHHLLIPGAIGAGIAMLLVLYLVPGLACTLAGVYQLCSGKESCPDLVSFRKGVGIDEDELIILCTAAVSSVLALAMGLVIMFVFPPLGLTAILGAVITAAASVGTAASLGTLGLFKRRYDKEKSDQTKFDDVIEDCFQSANSATMG